MIADPNRQRKERSVPVFYSLTSSTVPRYPASILILYQPIYNVNQYMKSALEPEDETMPRPREFDETAAVEAAIECFWRRGYEATSLRDLTAAMGLTAPSLYNAFGDKQRLFSRALKQYLQCTTRERLQRLEEFHPPREALSRFFAEIVEHSIKDRHRKGCFLVNSALEVAPHHAECRAVIAAQFRDIEAFFKRCILAAQADQSVSSGVDAENTARLLLGALLGIRVLARTVPEREMLQGVAGAALALLKSPRRRKRAKQ